jgi:hypothetical protein
MMAMLDLAGCLDLQPLACVIEEVTNPGEEVIPQRPARPEQHEEAEPAARQPVGAFPHAAADGRTQQPEGQQQQPCHHSLPGGPVHNRGNGGQRQPIDLQMR